MGAGSSSTKKKGSRPRPLSPSSVFVQYDKAKAALHLLKEFTLTSLLKQLIQMLKW